MINKKKYLKIFSILPILIATALLVNIYIEKLEKKKLRSGKKTYNYKFAD